jgi:hypothetical protein
VGQSATLAGGGRAAGPPVTPGRVPGVGTQASVPSMPLIVGHAESPSVVAPDGLQVASDRSLEKDAAEKLAASQADAPPPLVEALVEVCPLRVGVLLHPRPHLFRLRLHSG